jgi:hypothetical protein
MATPPQASNIKNAGVRYREQITDLGMEAQVDKKTSQKHTQDTSLGENDTDEFSSEDAESIAYFENELSLKKIRRSRNKKEQDSLLNELELLSTTEQKKITLRKTPTPSFPLFIFFTALFKDILDIPANLSIIGVVVSVTLSFFLALILFFWILGKMNGGWWKKRLISWLWKRYILVIIIEFLPGFQLIPTTTIFVLMAHYREKKIVLLANKALDALRLVLRKIP